MGVTFVESATPGVYTAAFVCEAVRSGVNSVGVGQAEAARSVGMTFGQTLQLVVLPDRVADQRDEVRQEALHTVGAATDGAEELLPLGIGRIEAGIEPST